MIQLFDYDTRLSVRVLKKDDLRLRLEAKAKGTDLSQYIRRLLRCSPMPGETSSMLGNPKLIRLPDGGYIQSQESQLASCGGCGELVDMMTLITVCPTCTKHIPMPKSVDATGRLARIHNDAGRKSTTD